VAVAEAAFPPRAALAGLSPADYRSHALHAPDCVWVEKNCYIDIWIELLHALRLDPAGMLAFTVAIDFEGDQWTFFKPPHGDLRTLYGLDVQELYVWRPLIDHAVEHLTAGRFISTEADAYWLPDTAGTDYRQQHTKTTIVLNEIDVAARRLHYFHNAGYFLLEGEDFARLFRLDAAPDPAFMPLFAELVRQDRIARKPAPILRQQSFALLREHVAWRPSTNPMQRFRERFELDLPAITQQGMQHYHAWVFGTLRQLGAASELSALYLRWLDPATARFEPAAAAFLDISTLGKSLLLKIARAVNAKRPLDASASFGAMADAWERASAELSALT
jgi:Domain of unknown function (DUF1839)